MDCPRCGSKITEYRLGEEVAYNCTSCQFVNIQVDHGAETQSRETWDDAVDRFHDRFGDESQVTTRRPSIPLATSSSEPTNTAVEELEIPGSGDLERRRRKGISTLYSRLRSTRSATKQELIDAVDVEDLGYANDDSFWSNLGLPALRRLPGTRSPDAEEDAWRFEETPLPEEEP